MQSNNEKGFLALVRAGLWEKDVRLSEFENLDYGEIYRLAEEQSVLGLVAAGLEHVVDVKPPKEVALQFVGQTLQLEQQNTTMNYFISVLVDKMRKAGIYTLLVKGQGVAQCYERPLWRACGDVDFFLSDENYFKAQSFLLPLASSVDPEWHYSKHLGMIIDPWVVELHGSLRCGLSSRVDKSLDSIKSDIIYGGSVRSWMNGNTQVFLPGEVNDAIYIFTHFLNHFYKGGLGLRQICDWCRLLWTYRETIDSKQLEQRLQTMKLITEWKAFGSYAVNYLGMPSESMPLFSANKKWESKARKISSFIMEVGNFGHNRDLSFYTKYPYLIRKLYSFGLRTSDIFRHAGIFPIDSIRFFPKILINGLFSVVRGE